VVVPSGQRYPRLTAYLAGLPEGLDSYPDCLARTSLCTELLDGMPSPHPRPKDLPEPTASILAKRPRGLWMSEVHVMAVSVTIADHFQFDDDAYLAWLHDTNLRYFSSLVLRVLMAFISPSELVARASARWSAVHQGSTLEARLTGPTSAHVELSFPPGLFAPILLRHFTAVWKAIFEHSKAKSCEVTLVDATDVHGVYEARWS
jgi:hypothetical protein